MSSAASSVLGGMEGVVGKSPSERIWLMSRVRTQRLVSAGSGGLDVGGGEEVK